MASKNSLTSKNFNQDREQGLRPGVVVCVISKEAKVLLGLKKEYAIWEFPQGGIEKDESLCDAIIREIEEELGSDFSESLFVPDEPLIAVDQVIFPKENIKDRILEVNGKKIPMTGKKYYFCVAAQVKDVAPAEGEYSDFKWVSFANGNKLVDTISQKGKKRVLKKALEVLKGGELII
jgi:putative (di)nucleoside polyphosphate hydrolase